MNTPIETAVNRHIMLDLETMAVSNRPAIIRIGAAQFDLPTPENPEGEIVRTFDVGVDLTSSLLAGLDFDPKTLEFWKGCTPEAKASLFHGNSLVLANALHEFTHFIGNAPGLYLWGHGAATDPCWLGSAYEAVGAQVPWSHRAPRDTRTLYDIAASRGWTMPDFTGTAHSAKDDAVNQAVAVISAYKFINARLTR